MKDLGARTWLVDKLSMYHAYDRQEDIYLNQMKEFVLNQSRCFERNNFNGHITGSSFVLDKSRSKLLLVHHKGTGLWLQPGGHSDGDGNTLRVAQRELYEETGYKEVSLVKNSIFDIDIHLIPPTEAEPRHLHYDVRFLFQLQSVIPFPCKTNLDRCQWIWFNELTLFNRSQSSARVIAKLNNRERERF